MKTLVFFLEELSAQALLEGIIPRLLPDGVCCQFVVFEGKHDLENNVVKKLRNWQKPNSVFLVMRDQDSADCKELKNSLIELCKEANKPQTLVRIACRELESFYFGDLSAVEKALRIDNLAVYKNKAQYRDPDNIVTPSKELNKITRGVYQKIGSSREIGKVISLSGNTSRSYMMLLTGITNLCKLGELNA